MAIKIVVADPRCCTIEINDKLLHSSDLGITSLKLEWMIGSDPELTVNFITDEAAYYGLRTVPDNEGTAEMIQQAIDRADDVEPN